MMSYPKEPMSTLNLTQADAEVLRVLLERRSLETAQVLAGIDRATARQIKRRIVNDVERIARPNWVSNSTEIFEDIIDSVRLAAGEAGCTEEQVEGIAVAVQDYIVNNHGSE